MTGTAGARHLQVAGLVARARTRAAAAGPAHRSGDAFPLSPVQRALWLHGQRHGRLETTLAPWTALLTGDLDLDGLAGNLREVLRLHPALRTVLQETADGPQCLVTGESPDVALLDLPPALAEGERVVHAVALVRDRAREIGLGGPVVSASIVRTGAREAVLGLTVHHLFFDGRSLRIVLDGLAGRMGAGDGTPANGAVLGSATGSVAQASAGAHEAGHWRETLADAPEPVLAARGESGRETGEQESRRTEHVLDADLSERLRALAAAESVSLFTVTLAGVALGLRELGAGNDVVLAAPTDVRTVAQENEVGYFVNTLPVRIRSHDAHSGRQLLRETGTTLLRALDARRMPVQEIVEIWRSSSPVTLTHPFLVMVDVVPGASHDLALPGVKVEPVDGVAPQADFPVCVTLVDEPRIRVVLNHQMDLVDADEAEQLRASLVRSFDRLVSTPDRPLSEYSSGQGGAVFLVRGKNGGGSRASGTHGQPASDGAGPEDVAAVAEAFRVTLGLRALPGRAENFFDLGGHSLTAMRLGIELRRSVGVKVTVRDVFERVTVADIAARVRDLRSAGAGG